MASRKRLGHSLREPKALNKVHRLTFLQLTSNSKASSKTLAMRMARISGTGELLYQLFLASKSGRQTNNNSQRCRRLYKQFDKYSQALILTGVSSAPLLA